MKRMHVIIAAFVTGLAHCGLLACRRAARSDGWQAGIKPGTRTDGMADPAARERLMEKFRQEELRQRPHEGRN